MFLNLVESLDIFLTQVFSVKQTEIDIMKKEEVQIKL